MAHSSSKNSLPLHAVHEGLDRYLEARRNRISHVLGTHLSLSSCIRFQARHFLKDLIRNPLNTLWAIPYLSIRKAFEVAEKLGWETAARWAPMVPKAMKTDFQKEVERIIQMELFGLSRNGGGVSELERELEKDERLKPFFREASWKQSLAKADQDIRSSIGSFCDTQNGFTDLAASSGIVLAARRYFGDSSLDIFGIGKRWASRWARDRAVSHFFLGKKAGAVFYRIVPPPAASSEQIYKATAYSLLLLAIFSTVVGVLSYPVKNLLGFQRKQFEKLITNVEDKLLLRLTKTIRESSDDVSNELEELAPAQI